ncbi:MAG TPA: FadR/GntR family transcriptional regulator [Anaerolineae bacterium]
MYSAIQSSRLYEQIIEQIQGRIMEGKVRPGDKLPSERELAEQFGVSRTAVREAVKAMREKGLLEVQPGRGTFVTDLTGGTTEVMRDSLSLIVKISLGNDLGKLVQVRTLLEPGIAALAAEMATPLDLETMQQAVNVMDTAMTSTDAYVEADLAFHLALARATQNPLIPVLIDPIVDLLREQRKRIFLVEGGPERGQYHHKQILAAIRRGDAATASQAMCAHLEQVRQDSSVAPGLD